MPKYIDAEKALKTQKIMCASALCVKCPMQEPTTGECMIQNYLHNASSEDVEPVIHAHWITCGIFDDFVKCSNCGWKAPFSLIGDFNIVGCPGCRAKMDEERSCDVSN